MNVAVVLLLGGLVITLWLFFWTRQRSLTVDLPVVRAKGEAPPTEAVIVLRGLGQVEYINDTLRDWLGSFDEVPDAELIARQIQPADNFFGLLAGQPRAAFQLNGRWVEASAFDTPRDGQQYRTIILREAGTGSGTPAAGQLDFTRAFRFLNQTAEFADITAGVEPTLQALLTVLHTTIPFDGGEINLYSDDGQTLRPMAWFGDARYLVDLYERGGLYPVSGGVTGWLLENRKPIILGNTEEIAALKPLVLPFPYQSVLGAPLTLGEQTLGTIELASERKNAYSVADSTLLFALNEAIAGVIQDAQEYAAQVKRIEDIASLQALVEDAAGRTEQRAENVYGMLAERVAELSNAAVCGILLYDEAKSGLVAQLPFFGLPDALARTLFVPLPGGSTARDIFERQSYWLSGQLRGEPLAAEMGLEGIMSAFGLSNTLWVPLQISRERLGMLAVFNKQRGEFNTRDVQNLKALATQATVVVESIRLFSREQRLDAELEGLQQMTFAIGTLSAAGDFFRELTSRIASLMKVRSCVILLMEASGTRLRAQSPATGFDDALLPNYTVDFAPGSVFQALWEESDNWYANNVQTSAVVIASGLDDTFARAGIRRTMFAKLGVRGNQTGVIQISDPLEERDFDDGDARLLTIFATQAATILENARLFREIQQASVRANALRRIAEMAGAMVRLDDDARPMLAAIADYTNSPQAFISILEGTGNLVTTPQRAYGIDLREPTVQSIYSEDFQLSVVMSRRPFYGNDLMNDPRIIPSYRHYAETLGLQRAAMVPLVVGDRSLGELGVANRERPYDRADLDALSAIAAQVAASIDRVLLYQATGQNLARRLEELDSISRVSNELTLTVDFDQILNVIRREALRATGASYSTIALLRGVDEWHSPSKPTLARRIGALRDTVNLEMLSDLELRAIERGAQPVIIEDYTAQTDLRPVPREARSAIAVSILFVDTMVGVIHLWDMQPGKFDQESASFLLQLATKASLGYGNYIRFQEQRERSDALRQRVDQLNRIFELSTLLSSSTNPYELLEAVAYSVLQSVGYDHIVMMLEEGDGLLHRVAQAGLPIDQFEASRVNTLPVTVLEALLQPEYQVEGSAAYLLPGDQAATWRTPEIAGALETRLGGYRTTPPDSARAWRDGDLLIATMVGSTGRVLGAMLLDQPTNELRPDRTTVELLEIFAYQAANAVESTRLYTQAVSLRVLNESVVNSIQQGIVVLDTSARILTINKPLLDSGWTSDAVGMAFGEYRPALGVVLAEPIQSVLGGGLPVVLNNHGLTIQVRADQLASLTEASNVVTSSTERRDAIVAALIEMRKLVGYDDMTIWRRSGMTLTLEAATGNAVAHLFGEVNQVSETGELTRLRMTEFPALRTMLDQQAPIVVHRTSLDDAEGNAPLPVGAERALSWMAVPMVNQGNVAGVMMLSSHEFGAYDSLSDQNIAFAFASQVANAAANAELFMQAFERTNEMSTLLEAAQITAAASDLDALLHLVPGLMFSVIEMEQCAVLLWNEIDNTVELIQDINRTSDVTHIRPIGQIYDLAKYRGKAQAIQSGDPVLIKMTDEPDQWGEDIVEMRARNESQRLIIPLTTSDGGLGLIQMELFTQPPRRFSAQNLRMARALGGQIAVGIQNTRLTSEMSDMVSESFALNDLSQTLSRALNVDEMMATLRQQLPQVLTASEFYVALYNAQTQTVSFPVAVRAGRTFSIPPRPLGNDEVSSVIRNNRMISIGADYFTPEELRRNLGIVSGEADYRSYLAIPVTVGSEVFGAIALRDSYRTRAFSLNDQRVVQTVASQLATVIQNNRLFNQVRDLADDLEQQVIARTQELEEERDRLDTLYQITSELSRTLDLQLLERRTLGMLVKALGADDGLVMRFEAMSDRLVATAAHSLPDGTAYGHAGEQIGVWLVERGEPELNVPDLNKWAPYDSRIDGAKSWRSAVAAVMQGADGDAIGALVMLSRKLRAFDEAGQRLLTASTNQVAAAINNAQLYALVRDQAQRLRVMLSSEKEEAEKNQAILDSISDGVILSDAEGRIIVTNPGAQRMLKLNADELIDRPLNQFAGLYGGSVQAWIEQVLAQTQSAQASEDFSLELRLNLDDAVLSARMSPVSSDGRFIGMVSVLRDITREAEVDRMKAQFVANVSHELRTPLTPIKGFTEMLMMGALGPVTDPQRGTLGMIKDNIARLTVLVDDILDISRIDGGSDGLRIAEVSVEEVVNESVDKQRNRPQHKDKTRTITLDIAPDLPYIQADRTKLGRIFGSIVDNAFNYSQDGGTIQVAAKLDGDRVLVSVADDGVGIPEKYREAVWKRFQRVEEHALKLDVSGTGLGLSIVKEMVEMHHGDVWFESEVGVGTTFYVSLPLVQPGVALTVGD
ncbi:MAG: GAF domain-containing protein [Anaerolineae bacterium]|nr:GAF domain-containing protein [Anaerolineae bacterium]